MKSLMLRADTIVRGNLSLAEAAPTRQSLFQLLSLIVLFGGLYGAVMGVFGGILGDRVLQVLYAAIKVPILLMVTFALSLPSFFIFNTLAGLRDDFGQVVRALLAGQAGMTILLASLAPITMLWNVSATGEQAAVLFNALIFGAATVGGQVLLRRYYRELLLRDTRHRMLMRLWSVLYAFVGIQMGWILRPFVGDPYKPVSFFRADTWGNAYVILFQMVQRLLVKH